MQKLQQIKSGELSAVDNIQQFLEKIAKDNPSINAVLSVNPHAIEDAKKVDVKSQKGRLAGLGIIVKACINVKGMNCNCASKTLESYEATYDADVVQKIKDEDGIILGIANMDEFASGIGGITSAYGKTLNPAAKDRVPGGSSSGSAASVAADFCDMALGTDTGGSIRNPASHCGIYGIKPAYGSVSRYGLIDLSMSLDQIGPLCKDLDGCKLLLEVIRGQSPNDPTTIPHINNAVPQKIKYGTSDVFEKLCTDKRIFEKTMSVVEYAQPIELKYVDLAIQTYYPLVYVEFFSGTRKFDGRKYGLKIEDSCGDEVLRRILGGLEISKAEHNGKYYRKALAVKESIREEILRSFETVDVIILPTTPLLPHKFNEELSVEDSYAYDAFTIPANLAGICAGVVPVGTIDDVPVGVQVFAPNTDVLFAAMDEISHNVYK